MDAWLQDIMPKLMVQGVKYNNDRIDQGIDEGKEQRSGSERSPASTAMGRGLEEAVVMHDVPPHLKEV